MRNSYLYTTCLSVIISSSLFFATPAMAETRTPNSGTPVTREELPALVKQVLLNDPTIMSEVIEKMQASQQGMMVAKAKEQIAKNKKALFSDPSSPTVGPANADVTLVEFFDYHCGYCKQALISISKLMDSDKNVRFIFKEYPILSEDSRLASKAALAVYRLDKNKYFEFHKAMFGVNGQINEGIILAEANKLGIDGDKLKKEMYLPEIETILNKNKELGATIGAVGTPSIVIGENFYPGAIPYEAMQKAVDEVRNPPAKKVDSN